MTPSRSNAFLEQSYQTEVATQRSLASLLAPMRAELENESFGWSLRLEPVRAIDVIGPWMKLADETATPNMLLIEGPTNHPEAGNEWSLADMARRLGVEVERVFASDVLLLNAAAVRDLLAVLPTGDRMLVLIDGPVEDSDWRAIVEAARTGQSALEAECRALLSARFTEQRTLLLHARTRRDAARFVAANLAGFVAAIVNQQETQHIAAPDVGLVDELLNRTGQLAVRPIETELFSTSIDVGINTNADGLLRPADGSLIYDRVSNTWHGE